MGSGVELYLKGEASLGEALKKMSEHVEMLADDDLRKDTHTQLVTDLKIKEYFKDTTASKDTDNTSKEEHKIPEDPPVKQEPPSEPPTKDDDKKEEKETFDEELLKTMIEDLKVYHEESIEYLVQGELIKAYKNLNKKNPKEEISIDKIRSFFKENQISNHNLNQLLNTLKNSQGVYEEYNGLTTLKELIMGIDVL